MSLSAALAACALFVAPQTLAAVISVESGGNPLAINVNHAKNPPSPRDAAEAERVAKSYIARGYSVDLGLMQVNSRNLRALGVTVADMFDPCRNVQAGATVLSGDYATAIRSGIHGEQNALRVALSYYNTGSPERGFENGYVARYYLDASPAIVRDIAGPSGRLKHPTSPYTADTTIPIPDDYFQQVAEKSGG